MSQRESVQDPASRPRLAAKAAKALLRAEAMGLFAGGPRPGGLGAEVLVDLAPALRRAGIAREAGAVYATRGATAHAPALLETYLDRIAEALEASPVPAFEWKRLTAVFGPDRLARLLAVSPASARRYARAARTTPDDVAARLHWLALVVGDLAGAYNEIGIRQWFERKRAQLRGRAPVQLLTSGWRPDDQGPRRVRDLAHALTGSPAT